MERKAATLEQIAIAYCLHYATDEGATIVIALDTSKQHAELHFRRNAPPHLHSRMKVCSWQDTTEELEMIKTFVPAQVVEIITDHPPGTTEHFSITHWNLS